MPNVPPDGWEGDIRWTKDVVPDVQSVALLLGLQVVDLQAVAAQLTPFALNATAEHARLDQRIDETAELPQEVTALAGRVSTLESVPAPVPVDLGPLTTRVTTLEQRPIVDLGPLTTRVTALEQKPPVDLTTILSRLTALETLTTSQASQISSLNTANTALANRVTAAETLAASQATKITALENRATAIEGVNTTQAGLITALEARKVHVRQNMQTVASLAANATRSIAITWPTAMPNANYDVTGVTDAAALNRLKVDSVSAKTTAGCTVVVRNTHTAAQAGTMTFTATVVA